MGADILTGISLIRQKNLKYLVGKYYKNISHFCVQHNLDYSAVHRYISGGMRIGNVSAKRFERIFNLKTGDFDKENNHTQIVEFPIYLIPEYVTSFNEILEKPAQEFRTFDRYDFSTELDNQHQVVGLICNSDAMAPHIKNGWRVLLDLSITNISDGATYAFVLNNKIWIRDIYFTYTDNKILLKATNEEFKDFTVNIEDVVIIGKPIYLCGKFYN